MYTHGEFLATTDEVSLLLSHSVLQERSCTLVEFMRLVENAIGADVLVQALAACRIATQRKAAAQAAAPPSSEAAEEKSERSTAKAGAAGQNPANLDVAQEAEDVLAIAGVNPEDEAKLMFNDQVERSKADVFFIPGIKISGGNLLSCASLLASVETRDLQSPAGSLT